MYSGFWLYFWIAALLLAGAAFLVITLIVAVRGGGELWRMFRGGVRKLKE
ncbi:MAG: hypothetical protein ACRD01_14405 [Terriglobales bacterium]